MPSIHGRESPPVFHFVSLPPFLLGKRKGNEVVPHCKRNHDDHQQQHHSSLLSHLLEERDLSQGKKRTEDSIRTGLKVAPLTLEKSLYEFEMTLGKTETDLLYPQVYDSQCAVTSFQGLGLRHNCLLDVTPVYLHFFNAICT